MGVFLGIDYGEKRIGLSVSDPEKKLARRYLTIVNDEKTLDNLKNIIQKEGVEKIILGIPVGFAGETSQSAKIRNFESVLEKEISIPIEKMNEVLTSKIARENLASSGVKNIEEIIDQEAARIILQDYLDFIK